MIIDKKVMKILKKNVGKEVEVQYVTNAAPLLRGGVLERIDDCDSIKIGDFMSIPFVGYGIAIQKITGENIEVLYENPLISANYNFKDDDIIDGIRAATFGFEIALRFRQERKELEKTKEAPWV